MSQSRFSIVLVGVSALLRRPLVSRLRPADGERSSWVVFAARGGRFESEMAFRFEGGRWAGWFFHSAVGASAFRFGDCRSAGWCFRSASWPSGSRLPLSACTDSEIALGGFVLPLGGLAFGLIASAFRHAPLRRLPSASWLFRLPLRRLQLGELAFGLTTSAFRHAPLRSCGSAGWFFCLPLRRLPLVRLVLPQGELAFGLTASAFRHAPLRRLPSAGWPSGSLLPLFGMHRFGNCPRWVGSSAFCFGDGRWAGWPSGSRLPLFGMHRSAPPHRRSEDRRSTPTRHLFHFKTLIPTC